MKKLPDYIQTKIYTEFLFQDFLWKFRRLFRFSSNNTISFAFLKKDQCKRKSIRINTKVNKLKKKRTTLLDEIKDRKLNDDDKKEDSDFDSDESVELDMKIQFPFFEYKDNIYCEFMLKLMNMLEIRFYKKNTLIAAEMDECMEVLFVEHGYYKVGY